MALSENAKRRIRRTLQRNEEWKQQNNEHVKEVNQKYYGTSKEDLLWKLKTEILLNGMKNVK